MDFFFVSKSSPIGSAWRGCQNIRNVEGEHETVIGCFLVSGGSYSCDDCIRTFKNVKK